MKLHTVELPSRLDFESSLSFVEQLRKLPEAEEYCFDFKNLRWVEPFGLLFVANAINQCVSQHGSCKFMAKNYDWEGAHSYAAHMGFFQYFGLNHGNRPGDALGGSTYLPIRITLVDQILRSGRVKGMYEPGDIIEDESKQLANLLIRQESGDLFDTLAYCFQELIRNVAEHSHSDTLGYCAQYWPSKQKVEIALLDTGIGLQASLRSNSHLGVSSDQEAINLALMPGVSSKTHKDTIIRANDRWQNSGYGLYMISRLCRQGGSFFIASGETGRLLEPTREKYISTSHQGTILRLEMKTTNVTNLAERLSDYRNDGDKIAKSYIGRNILTAPLASRFIRENFNLSGETIREGCRVRHSQYGEGIVIKTEIWNGQQRLIVQFGTRIEKVLSTAVIVLDDDLPF